MPDKVARAAQALVAVYAELAETLPRLEDHLRTEAEVAEIETELTRAEALMARAGPLAAELRQAGPCGRDTWRAEARALAEQVLARLARAQEEAHRRLIGLQAERLSVSALSQAHADDAVNEEKGTLVEV